MDTWIEHIKDRKIIAIDPGKEGGIAVYSIDAKMVVAVEHMPETMQDLYTLIKCWSNNAVAYLERVGGIPGMGASAMFNFGKGVGHIEMALLANKVSCTEVTPQKWQKELQVGNKGKMSTNQWKTKLKERAQQKYPTIERDFKLNTKRAWLSVSDALLILEYARLMEIKK